MFHIFNRRKSCLFIFHFFLPNHQKSFPWKISEKYTTLILASSNIINMTRGRTLSQAGSWRVLYTSPILDSRTLEYLCSLLFFILSGRISCGFSGTEVCSRTMAGRCPEHLTYIYLLKGIVLRPVFKHFFRLHIHKNLRCNPISKLHDRQVCLNCTQQIFNLIKDINLNEFQND